MDPVMRLKFVSEFFMFCFSGRSILLYHINFTIFLKGLIISFASVSIPQRIGNQLSLLECLTEDIRKKLVRGQD